MSPQPKKPVADGADEVVEPEVTEAKQEAAEAAPEAEAKPKRARRPRKPKAAVAAEAEAEPETAAEVTDVDKPAAEAATRKPAKPAPRRKRDEAQEPRAPVVVRAHAKYVRSSARKARLVCDHLRGKSVTEARSILAFSPRAVARDWSKVLESAIANAEHNHELVGDELKIAAAFADEGPTLKRFRPRAMGRATRIRKRTSHLTITLTPKD
jgi:ribosomal protein L22